MSSVFLTKHLFLSHGKNTFYRKVDDRTVRHLIRVMSCYGRYTWKGKTMSVIGNELNEFNATNLPVTPYNAERFVLAAFVAVNRNYDLLSSEGRFCGCFSGAEVIALNNLVLEFGHLGGVVPLLSLVGRALILEIDRSGVEWFRVVTGFYPESLIVSSVSKHGIDFVPGNTFAQRLLG
jgi:hypothetical protein